MEFLRSANAGGLLKMDGISILLDGVCDLVEPYAPTPLAMLEYLESNYPDAVGFTHRHPDHFLSSFVCSFEKRTNRKAVVAEETAGSVGTVSLRSFMTRHLGKAEEGLLHCSFLLNGSKRVLFTGDAAPSAIRGVTADVLIGPYAYGNTPAGIKAAVEAGAKHLILVHMPAADPDPFGIWDLVRHTIADLTDIKVHIPQMGENIIID